MKAAWWVLAIRCLLMGLLIFAYCRWLHAPVWAGIGFAAIYLRLVEQDDKLDQL